MTIRYFEKIKKRIGKLELKTFPYHVHLPDGVKESRPVALIDALDKIESIVVAMLESDIE